MENGNWKMETRNSPHVSHSRESGNPASFGLTLENGKSKFENRPMSVIPAKAGIQLLLD
jgi:hypothetical protein